MTKHRLLFLVLLAVLIPAAMYFADREVANWAHDAWKRPGWAVSLQKIPQPLTPGATIVLILAAIAALLGWRPGEWGRTVIIAAVAILLATALKDQMKFVFGRPWPETWVEHNPSWVSDKIFSFSPFHGGKGWASFPSGHTAVVSALAGVLWARVPRLKILWGLLIAATMAGLIVANYHFVSDCLAGLLLGLATAAGTLALLDRH